MPIWKFLGPGTDGHVNVPRSTVLFMAWLVPLIAVLAFLLGLMVGQLSASRNPVEKSRELCSVTIQVNPVTDPPSVCLLLPGKASLARRLDPASIMPTSFQALDNPTIDAIHEVGGGVCRADSEGARFEVEEGRLYWLVVVSPAKGQAQSFTKEEWSVLSQYFLPVETLTEGAQLHLERCAISGDLRRTIRIDPKR